jgi:hypothetical protein
LSLILEALRKLERDKDAPERGFVVMAHVPWARSQPRSRIVGLAVLALALAIAALATVLWRARGTKPAAGVAAARELPAPTPEPGRSAAPAAAPTLAPFRAAPVAPPRASAPTRPSTAPPTPPPAAGTELRLNAISRRDDRPVAILNDRLVREGDVFDGIRVIRIGETEVEVEVRGQRRVLTF